MTTPADPSAQRPRLLPTQDAPLLSRLDGMCFDTPWGAPSMEAWLRGGPNAAFVILDQTGEAGGFALLTCVEEEGELVRIGVLPALRGGGLGRALLAGVLEHARSRGVRRIWLEVRASNQAARALYLGASFRITGA